MSMITTSEALSRFIQNKTFEVEVGAVRPATLTKAEEFVAMLGENLPDTEVEALDPQDFRRLIQSASKRWGPLRLKQLRAFVLGWLRWCLEDEGLIERMPRTGSLKTPKVVAKPKETYTPEEIRTLFNDLDSYGRSLLGLGLFAGLNCSDIEHLTPASLDGHWFVQPRQKTGRPRRALLPAFVVSEVNRVGLPLSTKRGGATTALKVSTYWRNRTLRHLGQSRPFTALRTTLRTVAGHADGEALEIAVMGHSGDAASQHTGRASVGLTHYVAAQGITDERLRSIRRAVLDWLQ